MGTGARGADGATVYKAVVEKEREGDQDTASIHPQNTEEGRARGMESRQNGARLVRVHY